MKIGTLTLHLPFNYGNALQMLSLYRYLREQGYDTEVLSHWYYPNRAEVLGLHNSVKTLKGKIRFALNLFMFAGLWSQFRREAKLDEWLNSLIRWGKEVGTTGEFNAGKVEDDVVIVGSDQIWNPIHKTSEFFLLVDFPKRIKKIAYAASLGSDTFPSEKIPLFASALHDFSAISVRESSAVQILRETLQVPATLVCDPTLLHTQEEWCDILGFDMPRKPCEDLVAYLVTPNFRSQWREVCRVARESGRRVHFYAFQWSQGIPVFSLRHPFSSLGESVRNVCRRIALYVSGVRMHLSDTPSEFVQRIASCSGLVTDSFHGMMFATIFERKCNVVVGDHPERLQMSARLRNFTAEFGNPDILTPRMDVAALKPLKITPKLSALIEHSKKWLANAVRGRD